MKRHLSLGYKFWYKVNPEYKTEDSPKSSCLPDALVPMVRCWKCPSFGSSYQVQGTMKLLEGEHRILPGRTTGRQPGLTDKIRLFFFFFLREVIFFFN